MSRTTICIVDYGMGNHASVAHCLYNLGYNVHISKKKDELDSASILILPGVGAFPAAMQSLQENGLVKYLQNYAFQGGKIIGICLGMQLLASVSFENEYTKGLGIIPGEIVPLQKHEIHIGWNTLECIGSDALMLGAHGEVFYFNHSFVYKGEAQYERYLTRSPESLPAIISKDNVVGLQFHPEKSQIAGRALLKNTLSSLLHA